MRVSDIIWTGEPIDYRIESGRIEIITAPRTDLWQRSFYHFRNDNAQVLQMEAEEFFPFIVKTDFFGKSPQFRSMWNL